MAVNSHSFHLYQNVLKINARKVLKYFHVKEDLFKQVLYLSSVHFFFNLIKRLIFLEIKRADKKIQNIFDFPGTN